MKIIDRYVFWNFMKIFLLCYVSLVGLFVVFDLFAHLGNFLETTQPSRLITAIPAYYFLNSFVFVDVVFPLLIAVSATTATTLMARQNELIALSATGISPIRTVMPILVGALLISAAFTGIREAFLPARLVEINLGPSEFVDRSDEIEANRSFDVAARLSIDGEKVVRSRSLLVEPRVMLGRNLNAYGNRIVAREGVYLQAEGSRPAGWLLRGVSSPENWAQKPSLSDPALGETPIIFSPSDSPWLKDDEVFVATPVDLKNLAVGETGQLYGSTRELNIALRNAKTPREATKLAIRVHSRTLRPLADLLPLFLGLPFVFFRCDRNVFASLGAGSLLAGAYIGAQYASAYVGESLKNATIGVWAPFFIFIPVAANMFGKLTDKGAKGRTETARKNAGRPSASETVFDARRQGN